VDGARTRDVIELTPLAPSTDEASTKPVPQPSRPAPAASTPRFATRLSTPRVVAVSSLALAGAAFVTGTVGAVGRVISVNEYNDNRRCDVAGSPRSVQCAGVATNVDRFTTVMAAGYITAAVSGVAGGILALVFPRDVRVDVGGTASGGVMVWARGNF
jgi:hypothetical protein